MFVTDEITWWDYRVKAMLLDGAGKNKESKELAIKGLVMAKVEGREYGINEFTSLLKKLNNN